MDSDLGLDLGLDLEVSRTYLFWPGTSWSSSRDLLFLTLNLFLFYGDFLETCWFSPGTWIWDLMILDLKLYLGLAPLHLGHFPLYFGTCGFWPVTLFGTWLVGYYLGLEFGACSLSFRTWLVQLHSGLADLDLRLNMGLVPLRLGLRSAQGDCNSTLLCWCVMWFNGSNVNTVTVLSGSSVVRLPALCCSSVWAADWRRRNIRTLVSVCSGQTQHHTYTTLN